MTGGSAPETGAPQESVRRNAGARLVRGLEQLKGLPSHVDPRLTLGQIVGAG